MTRNESVLCKVGGIILANHQVATKGYSKVLTDSALQVNFFIHLHFFLKNAKTKVLSRPKPSVNMLRIHSGNTDGVNTSEIIIVTLRDLICLPSLSTNQNKSIAVLCSKNA